MSIYSDFFHNSNSKEFVKTIEDNDVFILMNPNEEKIISITNNYNYSFFEVKVNKTKCCIFYSSYFHDGFANRHKDKIFHFYKHQTFGSFCHDVLKSKKVKILRHCHITSHCGNPSTIMASKLFYCN